MRGRACIVSAWLLAAALFAPGVLGQATLKIVVIEGEDAVNIVRQQTAVAPIVEVRDRNDQPVAGAIVRFAVTRGRASFNGARTLTVTTNQAGRAVATGFTPNGAGALQLSATATFQGQTAAIAISQTSVLTAAGAGGAAAAGSGAAAGAAGSGVAAAGAGGGGISATTVGVVAGAAVGGTIAAKKVATGSSDDEGTTYVGTYAGPIAFANTVNGITTCAFVINVNGTLTMRLTTKGDGSVSGEAELHEHDTPGQVTGCASGPTGGDLTLGDMPVTGAATSLTFQRSDTFASGASLVVSFQGVLNGSEIVGTLNQAWGDATPQHRLASGSAAFPITLRQQ